MPAFIAGLALIYTLACVGAVAAEPGVRPDNPWLVALVLVSWALPIGAGWAAAETVRLVRGSRLRTFNAAHSWWLARLVRGMVAGVIGVGLSLAALVYIDQPPNDAAIVGLGGAAGTIAVLIFGRRIPRGACVGCGYDLRGLTPAAGGRCPECGLSVPAPAVVAG